MSDPVTSEAFESWIAYLHELRHCLNGPAFEGIGASLDRAADRLAATLGEGGRVGVAGNGGSAADANHLAAELVCMFTRERAAMDVISFVANTSVLTAWGNDEEFDSVFARQVHAHLRQGDALIVLSTSGDSRNIVQAAHAAHEVGAWSLALTGDGGDRLVKICDMGVAVPSALTPHVQELHLIIYHYLCARIEAILGSDPRWRGRSRYPG